MQTLSSALTLRSRLRVSIMLALALTFILVSHAYAAAPSTSSYSITLTPSSTQLHALPGGTANSSFTVVNGGPTGYMMAVSAAPYHVNGINYDPQFTLLPGKTDASKWIHFDSPTSQFVSAGLPQTIAYVLSVPPSTPPGGYYAVIFAETVPPAHSGVTSHNRVGDILYITVDGTVTQQGDIQATKLPRLVLGNSLPLGVIVRNSGGLHFLTTVKMTATTLQGHSAFTANLQRYVLPGTQREVSVSWTNLPLFGIYKVNRGATVAGKFQSASSQSVIVIRPWLLVILTLTVWGGVGLGCRQFFRIAKRRAKVESKK